MDTVNNKKYTHIIFILAIIGILISGYLLNFHYTSKKGVCDISKTISCSSVNKSSYSEFLGYPVALYGIFGYSILAMFSFLVQNNTFKKIRNKSLKKIISYESILIISALGLLFSGYLTYVELFVIKSICLFCFFSQINIIAITALGYKLTGGIEVI